MAGGWYSFFGTQEGDFSLTLRAIEAGSAVKDGEETDSAMDEREKKAEGEGQGLDSDSDLEGSSVKASRPGGEFQAQQRQQQSWLQWAWGGCGKL